MITLNVNFGNSNKFFFEGEKLNIKLEVYVHQSVNIASILVNFLGVCICKSDPADQEELISELNSRIEKEIYFDDVIPLFVASAVEKSLFSPGVHTFPMEYQLPYNLPTSVESSRGFVRYSLSVVTHIDRNDIKTTHYFTVVGKVDLNSYSSVIAPITLCKLENSCILSALCTRNGSVRACVNILKNGFVPGEHISINAEINNFNSLPISWVKAYIVQILKYHCSKIKSKRVVSEITRGCIMSYDSQSWISENLLIPAIPPSSCILKNMITIKYRFYFSIKPSWQEKPFLLKHKLLIGTIPLKQNAQSKERAQNEDEMKMLTNGSDHNFNLEPCVFGPHAVDEEKSILFSPLYPITFLTF